MSGNAEFSIRTYTKRRVLTKYNGPGGDVVVPAGVTKIGGSAFEGCTGVTSVTIPAGVTEIGESAFSGCTGLTSVTLPDGVTVIGSAAFSSCTGLTSVTLPDSVTMIGWSAFANCTGLTSITLPDSLTVIEWSVFANCTSLTSVTIPAGVTEIYGGAFSGCTSLTSITLPLGLQSMSNRTFPDLIRAGQDCPQSLEVKNLAHVLLNGCKIRMAMESVYEWPMGSTPAAAAIYLTSGVQKVRAFCERQLYQNENESVAAMTGILTTEKVKPTICKRAAEFALACGSTLKNETLFALYDALTAARAKKAAELLEPAVTQRKAAGDDGPEETSAAHPVEAFCRAHYTESNVKRLLNTCGLSLEDLPTVRYGDSEESAPPFVLGCVLADYLDVGEVRKGYTLELSYHRNADQIAAALDSAAFRQALETVYDTLENRPLEITRHYFYGTKVLQVSGILRDRTFLVPYCRFGSPQQVRKVLSSLKDWHDWNRYEKPGRQTEYLAQYALCLSDCREALLWADKNGLLPFAAKLRGTDADVIRDTVLTEFGLDGDGRKTYDLGGRQVTVSMAPDLSLMLYDETAGKVVKSIPKKDADPDQYEAATADLADLKKNLKKAVKGRCDQLFAAFLRGSEQDAAGWKASYLANPVLRQVASLLVWAQGNATFTVTAQGTVDSAGQPYEVGEQPVKVAHPMEMDRADLARWQKYFTSHALKQPFAQVWEPVVDFSQVKEDRYSGIELPANHLRSRDKHGIRFHYDNATSELETSFAGLSLVCEFTQFQRHWMDQDARVVFGRLKVKTPGRAANHVLALLDKWTVEGRILKDDASAVEHLDSFTLAQVTELLNLAIEHNCTNCTAALLAYKNDHFADFDPMDVFTLE